MCMKLTILNDNEAKGQYEAEHGLSFLIEDSRKILFDTGPSDVFLRNAKKLGIILSDIDVVVLSHGHWDHGTGLKYLENTRLICHPGCFIRRLRKSNRSHVGLPLSHEEAEERFDVVLTRKPFNLSDNIIFLGEVPRMNDFESKETPFCKEDGNDDFVIDDSALALTSPKGLMIVTGCSHSGICNIIEYAKQVTGVDHVLVVIGGFHLGELNTVTEKTIEYFRRQDIPFIYPSHCVKPVVIERFERDLHAKRVFSGDILQF